MIGSGDDNLVRTIGETSLPAVGLGCMSLSQAYLPLPDEADATRLVHTAIDMGYRHFDTARLYGLGHNEQLLSNILAERRSEMFIASKCGIEFDDGKRRIDCRPETIRRAVETSLRTLKTDFIDLYYLHRRDFDTPIEESVGALADLKREGKIGGIGLSEMSAATIRKAAASGKIDAVQTEYSLWTRNAELGVLDTCEELGIAFVAFSPVGRGALAGAVKDPAQIAKKDLRKNHPRFTDEHWMINRTVIDEFEKLAASIGVTPGQLSLAWVLSRGPHVHVIPGTSSDAHLAENFRTLQLRLDPADLERAGNIVNHSTISGHRYPEGMRKTIDTEEFSSGEETS